MVDIILIYYRCALNTQNYWFVFNLCFDPNHHPAHLFSHKKFKYTLKTELSLEFNTAQF